jgi:hypothetical protein
VVKHANAQGDSGSNPDGSIAPEVGRGEIMTDFVYDTEVDGETKVTGILGSISDKLANSQEYVFTIKITALKEDPTV